MYCKECNAVVMQIKNEYKKTCTCEAPIIADMEATVKQQSSLE